MKHRVALAFGLGLWGAAAGGGIYALTAHNAEPGRAAEAASLPVTLRTSGHATVVMVAHPNCPCTRASLRALSRAASEAPGAADIVVLFAGTRAPDRVAADLRAMATAISGARVIDDPGGAEAKRLGAFTSGTVVFYDDTGRRRFAGGITASRGHDGDSAGSDTLRALLAEASRRAEAPRQSEPLRQNEAPLIARTAPEALAFTAGSTGSNTPVFGCALTRTAVDAPLRSRTIAAPTFALTEPNDP